MSFMQIGRRFLRPRGAPQTESPWELLTYGPDHESCVGSYFPFVRRAIASGDLEAVARELDILNGALFALNLGLPLVDV